MNPTRQVVLVLTVLLSSAIVYSQTRRETNQQDPGIDLAVVISTRANLRERPSLSSKVLRELEQGEALAVVSRAPVGPWYNVIHIESSTEGWINGNTITIRYTEKKRSGPVFQETETGTTDDPSIEVKNDTDRILYLKVGDDERIVISPRRSRTITKYPGTYSFYATVPAAYPAFGEREFRSGIIYTWTFYIATR